MIEKGWVAKTATPASATWSSSACSSTSPRRRASCRDRRSCPAQDTRAILAGARLRRRPDRHAAPRRRPSSTGGPDVPSVIPPSPRPTISSSGTHRRGRLVFQRCADCGGVRHPPAPMCGECHSVEWDTQESARARTRLHVDRVAPSRPSPTPSRASWCWSSSTTACASCRTSRRRCRTRSRTACEVALSVEEVDGVVLPQFRPAAASEVRVMALSRDTAIVGHRPDRVLQALRSQRAPARGRSRLAAVADAGLTPADIDGMVTFAWTERRARTDALRWASRSCASPPAPAAAAAARARPCAAAARGARRGAANAVVVYRAFNERSGRRFGQPITENNKPRVLPPGWNWYLPFGLDTPAKTYSLWYQRYMHTYGVTNEDFGRYAVVARKHAATNPTRGSTSGRSPWRSTRSRAGSSSRSCAARLLPGERRRCRARGHERTGRRDLPHARRYASRRRARRTCATAT